jgi:signal transduction histidine kinase
MRISTKISLFILFLLAVLAVNTFIGLVQLSNIEHELKKVVNRDIALTEAITAVAHFQLEKAVLFERVLRVSEEMAFEDIPPARREYLLSYVTLAEDGFRNLSGLIQDSIRESRDIIKEKSLKETGLLINDIEKSYERYDISVGNILTAIRAGDFQLSLEDIEEIEREESKLNKDIRLLLEEVQGFTRASLTNAEHVQESATETLWVSLSVSLVISALLIFLIIRGIVVPLKKMAAAAHQIGNGRFDVRLDLTSKDEIGELAGAFNTMAQKLSEALQELKDKNEMLARNLAVTEVHKKDLEKANLALDTFIKTVSHDIRAPLTGIGGYAAFLEKYYENKMDEKSRNCISGIRKSAYRLNSLIEDLLSFARISRLKNPPESVDVRQLVEATIERLEPSPSKSRVIFEVKKDLPVLLSDPVKLGTVFLHLLDNAVKFSSKNNQARPRVEVGCSDTAGAYEFFVRDNGIGIPPEHHLDIFDMFKKLHNPSEYPGTGAGLSIVRGIVEDWDGKIWVRSSPGQGTVFYFTVPKKDDQKRRSFLRVS